MPQQRPVKVGVQCLDKFKECFEFNGGRSQKMAEPKES